MKSLISYINVPSDITPSDITPDIANLEYNMVYAIPLKDIDKFIMTVLPSESELKTIYKHNFILNEITEDGYYVFIKEK